MEEQWRQIAGYEELYSVSNLGKIRRDKGSRYAIKNKILKHILDCRGYVAVNLHNNGSRKIKRVHILVSRAFLGDCPDGHSCNHKDGDKKNSCLSNLEYVTFSENMRHAYRLKLIYPRGQIGEANINAKLNNSKVKEIRKIYETQKISQQKLAKQFNVSQNIISSVLAKRSWKHV